MRERVSERLRFMAFPLSDEDEGDEDDGGEALLWALL